MPISLTVEQEQVLTSAIKHGLARNSDEALDKALDSLRERLPTSYLNAVPDESVAAAARRLANFGRHHNLSLGGMSIKELNESRP